MNTMIDGNSGIVFNIQRYSLHDGPGIRTVIFLKGCPLRCWWCSNPESQQQRPELAYNQSKCIGCLGCKTACGAGAIAPNAAGLPAIDRAQCQSCFQCARQCPAKALEILGRPMQAAAVVRAALADSAFYARSGGGLTLSGGEPLLQPGFVVEILKEAKKQRLDATLETCGHAAWDTLREVAGHLKSTIIYDLKSLDAVKHQQFTGVSNRLILDNLRKLRQAFPKLSILVRTPIIPGFNDTRADIAAILEFLAKMPGISYELLPYHRLGQQKYDCLGRPYPLGAARLHPEILQELQEYIKKAGLPPAKQEMQ